MPEGDVSAGVNMAQVTAMNNSIGQMAPGQRLCMWLPNVDYKPLIDLNAMMQWHSGKQILPGIEACFFLPKMRNDGILAKLLGELFSQGFALEDYAGLTQEDMERIKALNTGDIPDMDTGQLMAIRSNLALRNVAINQADGPELG